MDNQQQGEELNQLARLLFGRAANHWYLSILIETVAGIIGIIMSFFVSANDDIRLLFALIGVVLFIYAYYLNISYEKKYNLAETMRRQSVFTEGLGWQITKTQFSIWKNRAGAKILKLFKFKVRDEDYYATQESPGPKKLLEMTIESCFYTRNLYCKLKKILFIGTVTSFALLLALIIISSFSSIPSQFHFILVYLAYLIFPLILSIDLTKWTFRLYEMNYSLEKIEEDLEKLEKDSDLNESKVMRLVSEYNCIVANGIPIHDQFFKYCHGYIDELWKSR